MKATLLFPQKTCLPEGPKSRGYELSFAWRVFMQFIKGFRSLHFLGPALLYLVPPGLKKIILIISKQWNLVNDC